MPTKPVRAVCDADGHVRILDAIDLPEGQPFTILVEVPAVNPVVSPPPPPRWRLGAKLPLTREDYYDDGSR